MFETTVNKSIKTSEKTYANETECAEHPVGQNLGKALRKFERLFNSCEQLKKLQKHHV